MGSLPLSHLGSLKGNIVLVVQLLSCVQFFAMPWTVAPQAPLSMRFSRQEYWSEVPLTPTKKHPPKKGPEPQSELSLPYAWHSELVSGVATVADTEAAQKANGMDSHSVELT